MSDIQAAEMMTDIVVATCGRLPLLQRTLAHIWERTTTPYRLQVIDDASSNAEYVAALQAEGKLASAHLHTQRAGIAAHVRALSRITVSDPVVLTDDDVLCPQLDPDWLARGLEAMRGYPKLGLLALNNPQCNVSGARGSLQRGEPVTFCRNVGATFLFVRRAVLETCRPPDGARAAIKVLSLQAAKQGWRVGYLTHTYCQHIGGVSVRLDGRTMRGELKLVAPLDGRTLEPPDAYKG